MGLPTQSVTLSVEQIHHLNQQLTHLRHEINNQLSTMIAITELVRANPDAGKRLAGTLSEQLPKIAQHLEKFSK